MVMVEDSLNVLIKQISNELALKNNQVQNVIEMLQEGNTVPFIARYRKEMTGSLDEVQIRSIMERWNYLENLGQRKLEVIRSISDQGKMTDELALQIEKAGKLQEVEDLYRPYKQKRRTKATVAKEKGLEPLALWLLECKVYASVREKAAGFLSEEKEVSSIEEAITGAQDIIAELLSDDAELRKWIRNEIFKVL